MLMAGGSCHGSGQAESFARPSGVDDTSKEYATAVNRTYRTEGALARLALRAMRIPA